MSKEKQKEQAIGKKALRNEVAVNLESALVSLKSMLSEKKFQARLKKAVKILTEDLDTAPKKENKKAPAGKPAVKPAATAKKASPAKPAAEKAPAATTAAANKKAKAPGKPKA